VHIGVVTTSYPRHAGDSAGRFVWGLNRYLLSAGHTVEVLAADDLGGRAEVQGPGSPVPVLRIPSPLFYGGGAPDKLFRHRSLATVPTAALESLRFSARLGRLFFARQAGYDAVISHWLVPCGLLAAALLPGPPSKPHVAIAHSSDIHLLRACGLASVAHYVSRRARLVYTSASLRIFGAPGVVAPMGIDVAEFCASAFDRAAARQRLAVTGPTVLFLGRLVPVKGVEVLLSAVAALPGLTLWIAGDGPLRQALAAQAAALGIASRVRFWGAVAPAARRELLLACDCLVVPSLVLPDGRTEGAPQVILEGLAVGCAVLASAVGGIPELLGDAGTLVPPGRPQELSQALAAAMLDTSQAAVLLRRAHARRYDWSAVAPRILGPDFAPELSRCRAAS